MVAKKGVKFMTNKTQDVQFARLDERLKALDSKVDVGFSTLTQEVKDLKDNLAQRVETVERIKLSYSDFDTFRQDISKTIDSVQSKINNDIEKRVGSLETWKTTRTEQITSENRTYGWAIAIIVFLQLLNFGIFLWHLTGYKI